MTGAGPLALVGSGEYLPVLEHVERALLDGRPPRYVQHFDRLAGWVPDLLLTRLVDTPAGVTVVGVDEDTALVGGPHAWRVEGRQSAWVLTADGRTEHPAGSTLHTPG